MYSSIRFSGGFERALKEGKLQYVLHMFGSRGALRSLREGYIPHVLLCFCSRGALRDLCRRAKDHLFYTCSVLGGSERALNEV